LGTGAGLRSEEPLMLMVNAAVFESVEQRIDQGFGSKQLIPFS